MGKTLVDPDDTPVEVGQHNGFGSSVNQVLQESLLVREFLFIFLVLAYIGQDAPVTGHPVPDDDRTGVKKYRYVPFPLVYQDILIKGDLAGAGQAGELPHQPVKIVGHEERRQCDTAGKVVVVKPQCHHSLGVHESDVSPGVNLHYHLREQFGEGLENDSLLKDFALPFLLCFTGLPGNKYVS